MPATAADFSQMFREEHRLVRDALFDLQDAFKNRDRERTASLLGTVAALTGPHFRYEEEALYPSLTEIFGEEYIEKLLSDHDRVIGTAQKLVELSKTESLSDDELKTVRRYIQGIFPHVSDCDGLSIMVERLPGETVDEVFAARDRAGRAGLDLLSWASQVRTRSTVVPG